MSSSACLIVFSPFLAACAAYAVVDIGRRIHGGPDTPTPVHEALGLAARRVGRTANSALTLARAVAVR